MNFKINFFSMYIYALIVVVLICSVAFNVVKKKIKNGENVQELNKTKQNLMFVISGVILAIVVSLLIGKFVLYPFEHTFNFFVIVFLFIDTNEYSFKNDAYWPQYNY